MVIHVCLWFPLRKEDARHVLRIRYVRLESVPVVVVAGVFLIEPRRIGALVKLAADVMITIRNGLPIDVGPMLMTFIRPPLCFSRAP